MHDVTSANFRFPLCALDTTLHLYTYMYSTCIPHGVIIIIIAVVIVKITCFSVINRQLKIKGNSYRHLIQLLQPLKQVI